MLDKTFNTEQQIKKQNNASPLTQVGEGYVVNSMIKPKLKILFTLTNLLSDVSTYYQSFSHNLCSKFEYIAKHK